MSIFFSPAFETCAHGRWRRVLLSLQVLVAQWIAHQTSNLGVAGSNPVEHALFIFRALTVCQRLRFAPRGSGNASIAQLAEHVLRKHKVTSSILVGGLPVVTARAVGLEV